MEITGIRYWGPVFDSSGYARACREYLHCLHEKGVPLTISPVSFDVDKPDLGELGKTLQSYVRRDIPYNVNIMHLTPEHFPLYKDKDAFNVGITIWETDRIPDVWVKHMNDNVDLVIVPCEWNKQVFEECGVTVPIGIVPYGIEMSDFEDTERLEIEGVRDDDFVFYSIFQWTERKNPLALMRCFMNAFHGRDDVVLVMKTYKSNTSEEEVNQILSLCKTVKKDFSLKESQCPRIMMIGHILSDVELVRLHNRGDCYVSTARGEGWGLGLFHAMAAGTPAISPGGSGNEAFMTPENSYLTKYGWSPVFGMYHIPWYDGTQFWVEPDQQDMIRTMKHVEANRDEAIARGQLGKKYISENFNFDVVYDKLVNVIEAHMSKRSAA